MSVFRYKGSKVWTMIFTSTAREFVNQRARAQRRWPPTLNASAGASWRKERQAFASGNSRNCSRLPRMNG